MLLQVLLDVRYDEVGVQRADQIQLGILLAADLDFGGDRPPRLDSKGRDADDGVAEAEGKQRLGD
jgi:hypothetical protein